VALRVLLTDDQHAAVGPLERALWEMWINGKYLLMSPDTERAAAKVWLAAKIDALEFLRTQTDVREQTIHVLQTGIDSLARVFPESYTDLLSQRKQRKGGSWHWSGVSFSAIERKIAPDPVLYKLLSWDSHATIGTLRDVRISIAGEKATISFGRDDNDPMANPARVAYLATEVLFNMFEDWRQLWKLPPLYSHRSR